jgi:hypothetical protein
MKLEYTTPMGTIRAALNQVGANEDDLDKLYFFESMIASVDGIGIRLTVFLKKDDGKIIIGEADYFENLK